MKFRKNEDGKIILKDRKGKEVPFDFPVDAKEALAAIDREDGKPYFTLPASSTISIKEELEEKRIKREKGRGVYKSNFKKSGKKIVTTSGKPIPEEFLDPDDNLFEADTEEEPEDDGPEFDEDDKE